MPGELANIISGRVANLLNLRGPSFITDAACASSLAAVEAATDLLTEHHCDAVITGGVDRNMGASSFVKFCKIGALSATGTRPFGEGADGFVMGEGAAAFLLKRLADAERDGDRIYAVIRGVGASSDGKGKGITAPNPIGQKLAVQRAWQDAGLDPATARMVEAHGTSTKVGDVVEVESLAECFASAGRGAIALGSVKSNVGHLKAGAGAAGLLEGRPRRPPPAAAADAQRGAPESRHRLLGDAVHAQPRAARVAARRTGRRVAPGCRPTVSAGRTSTSSSRSTSPACSTRSARRRSRCPRACPPPPARPAAAPVAAPGKTAAARHPRPRRADRRRPSRARWSASSPA